MTRTYPAQEANLKSQDYVEGPARLRRAPQAELAESVEQNKSGIVPRSLSPRRS